MLYVHPKAALMNRALSRRNSLKTATSARSVAFGSSHQSLRRAWAILALALSALVLQVFGVAAFDARSGDTHAAEPLASGTVVRQATSDPLLNGRFADPRVTATQDESWRIESGLAEVELDADQELGGAAAAFWPVLERRAVRSCVAPRPPSSCGFSPLPGVIARCLPRGPPRA